MEINSKDFGAIRPDFQHLLWYNVKKRRVNEPPMPVSSSLRLTWLHGYLGRLNRGQVETSYEMLVHVGKVVMNLLHVATQSLGQFPEYQPHLGTSRKFKFSRFYLFERQLESEIVGDSFHPLARLPDGSNGQSWCHVKVRSPCTRLDPNTWAIFHCPFQDNNGKLNQKWTSASAHFASWCLR